MTDKPRDSVTPFTTQMNVTQVAVEEWTPVTPPKMQVTQVVVEEWGLLPSTFVFTVHPFV